MEDLRELYQEVILDHNKNPKNFRKLENASHTSEGYNPFCGDRINLYLQIEDDHIKDISFEGSGCAISKASSSVMTAELKGKSMTEAKELFKKFQGIITGKTEADFTGFDKLSVFAGVREFPVRVKCAALAWHTMLEAIQNGNNLASTE